MGLSIYHINQAIAALCDPETGEITDWEAFDALQMAREEKLENVACYYKNTVAEAREIKAEENELAKRRKVLEARSERLKGYLERELEGQKFQTAKCAVTFRNTPHVEVSDPTLAIDWALTHGHGDIVTFGEPTISKTELQKLLKTEEIPGAELVYSLSCGIK